MKQAIVNFCKSTDTGLFLLDMPTGFGKTYSVLEFMVDYYDSPEFKDKKIFFVTTLKKNLPDKELREHFAKRGKADDYDKYCLRIEANADMVVEKLDELYRARKIPAAITMKQEFKDLHGSVKLLNEYRDKKRELKGTSKDIINVLCKNAEDAIRKQQEGAFRKVIESELKQFRTPKEKLKNIANNLDYHWIGELYPAVYTREKRIVFMSMDKFFLGNTTIIEPTYSFYNNDITKNAIIFIDEFDATRDRLLNQIITRGLENHIDYLGLFHRVYASLKTRDFPAELTTASKLQQAYLDEHKNAKNPTEIIEGFGGVFDETYDRFAMQYSFKTEEDGKGDRSRNFIFNDLQFHSVFEGENAFIDIDTDMKAKQNWLRFTKRRPTEKEGGVLSLLASVKGCLTYFQNGARNLSFNYKHHKDEDKRPGDDDYTFENAIESVLTEFHLSREQIRYLKPIVMGGQVKSKKDKKDSNGKMSLKYFDRSVYNRGFRYYDFIDDPNHSMRSEIQLFDFQDSPERILLHLSEKAQIIGISATATLDTVVGNYDLEYLQRMLQDKYYVMPEADRCRLQESFQTFVANYDKVNIHVEPVSYNADDRVELSEIFNGNEALIKKYAEKLSISFERVEYAKNNFIRVVKVMKAFILNDSVKSFLCLNNKLPQENKGLFDIKLLEEFADAIIKLYGIKGLKGKDLLYSINSEDYDAKRAEFIQRLSKGEKLFVISSYNTVGAGQNLQYKAPGNATIVAVNDYDRGDMEKDFDCIYLEKPTNLLVNVDSKKGIEAEDLIRFVYQMEFLMERGEVSRKDGIAVIKDAFICFSGGYTFSGKKGEPYKTDSVNNFAIRTLIQAVGRICRTGLKNPDIYIYVDNTILTDYDLSVVEQRMLNPEFAELVKVGKTYYNGQANENLDIAVMENRAGTLALKAMQIINELKRNWTDDSIDYWKALRELCLMRPTLSRKNVEQNSQYQLVYMCAPGEITAYSYEQEGDYNKNINIKFDGSLPQKMSEDEVHLKEIMQIPGVKALFEKHGYATSFVPSEFILTPPMFNNIYKGALGEVVGKYILEQYAGVTLQEMPPEFFELFDYTLGNGVYIDFKRASLELYKDIVKKEVLNSGINIVDAVHTETSEDYLQDVADGINKIIPEAKCSVGKRLSKKKLNVRYIHDKSFYSDSEVDPHQESMEDYVVQHITVENFKHQSSAAVYNILKELVIKKDIAIGKITLVDWSQYGYKADWLFGVVVDGTYYFMTIHPDGSFKIEALKRNLFTMTEYDKYMDYFGLNEENKNDYRGVIGLVKDAEGNINLIKDTNMYSMPDYTAMGDVLKNVASEGRFPGKDVVTWLRLVMDTTDKIKVHAELDIVIPHIDVNAEYTKANVMGLFKGITTKKEVVRYVFENTGIMLYAYLRGEEERREYLSGNIDINYFDYDDTHAKYSVGEIGNGMKYTIERASVVREIQAVEGSKLIFKKVLPLMGVEFVRYGMLTVVPFPFKYLREYIVKEEKSV